jgi:hypothetical protein
MVSGFDRNLSCSNRRCLPEYFDPEVYEITKTIIGNRKCMNTISPGNDTGGMFPTLPHD